MNYYVYALIDPTNENKPFYIRKGTNNRIKTHFKEALVSDDLKAYEDVDIVSIAENEIEEQSNGKEESEKVKKLKELFQKSYK